jgi:hypothetical protein
MVDVPLKGDGRPSSIMFWNGGVCFSSSFFLLSAGFAPPSLARKKKV